MTAQPAKKPKPTITGGKQVGKAESDGLPVGGAYDLKNFYVASTDKDHQKTSIKLENGKTISVPLWLAVHIRKWVDDERTPYRYEYDMIRDALVHLVVKLTGYDQNVPASWAAFIEMAEMEREASEASWQEQQVERIKQLMDRSLRKGDQQLYQSTLKRAGNLMKDLRSPYKEDLQRSLNVTPIGQQP